MNWLKKIFVSLFGLIGVVTLMANGQGAHASQQKKDLHVDGLDTSDLRTANSCTLPSDITWSEPDDEEPVLFSGCGGPY